MKSREAIEIFDQTVTMSYSLSDIPSPNEAKLTFP